MTTVVNFLRQLFVSDDVMLKGFAVDGYRPDDFHVAAVFLERVAGRIRGDRFPVRITGAAVCPAGGHSKPLTIGATDRLARMVSTPYRPAQRGADDMGTYELPYNSREK
jgi:hypothetical protein